jgi:ribosomal protein L36
MSLSKSSNLSAGCRLVQRHGVVRVTLKKIPVFDFLKFPFSNRKKIRAVARYFFLHWAATLSAEPLKSR